ncbi:homoserine dehydrogenase [Brevibacterium marinum]|uniref:Homoserine dehydrogenase n=1 Tax=Brevibacterium marinum TaxID=418643 RepID=A0A846S4H2_9MICO|nr:homoserine dehydrogenase [Brevibacterium marinum]
MKTLRVAITGVGNVGSRIGGALEERAPEFARRFNADVRVVGVSASTEGLIDGSGISGERIAGRTDFVSGLTGQRFFDELEADVLIEAGPSNYVDGAPGLSHLEAALEGSMDVICVSKGALVVAGDDIYRRAAEAERQVRVSGAAASAMPTVDFLTYDLAGAQVTRFEALLTGTTTFVLDTMYRHGWDLDDAVAEAQESGIAEPQPEFDVDGWDTAAKLVVIARAVFNAGIPIESVPRQSVKNVNEEQIDCWKQHDIVPRLVGILELDDSDRVTASVQVKCYPKSHPFSLAEGSMKAVNVSTKRMGDYSLLGGASSLDATAAAAIKDLEHILTCRMSSSVQ